MEKSENCEFKERANTKHVFPPPFETTKSAKLNCFNGTAKPGNTPDTQNFLNVMNNLVSEVPLLLKLVKLIRISICPVEKKNLFNQSGNPY
jgi:hypothetical protein